MSSASTCDDEHDQIGAQLRASLREDIGRVLQSRRPVLSHLNADTSFLLSLPEPGSQNYWHILIDPWLRGSQADVFEWFSRQRHAHESAVQTIAEAEELIGEIEQLASSPKLSLPSKSKGEIDAVVVSHEFTDHMHKATLLEVSPSVPVLAASKAAAIIRSWQHFHTVITLPTWTAKDKDWRATSVAPLPPWLGISRLGVDKIDLLYYHSAVLFAVSSRDDEAEGVIYTPHGIMPEDLKPVATAQPPIRMLALLHGLHDVSIGGQLNLGAHNGLKVQRMMGAKYWLGTHDEIKFGWGVVSYFLKRQVFTVKDALEREIQEKGEGAALEDVNFFELGNGESFVLE